jgi:hypothetical protein
MVPDFPSYSTEAQVAFQAGPLSPVLGLFLRTKNAVKNITSVIT